MKKLLSIIAMAIATVAVIGCEQFSTSYERIDNNEFRMLKYIWDPADAAPGDTITLTAVFAGKRVNNLDSYMTWWVSFNVMQDLLGTTTVVDSQRLENISKGQIVHFSDNTQAIQFKIPVPSDIVKNNKSIPENWLDALPMQMGDDVPLTKTNVIDLINFSAANADNLTESMVTELKLIPILQYFTVPMRVSTKIQESGKLPHTIVSTQYIRYNSCFKDNSGRQISGIPLNRIPDSSTAIVIVYKVEGDNVFSFDKKSGFKYESTILEKNGSSVIEVKDGYTYFLDAITSPIDTTVTMDGKRILETHRIYRQFQLDSSETKGIHYSKFMDIENLTGKITMPTDKSITTVTFWLTITDEASNERMRPHGGTLVERTGRLIYK